MTYCVVRTVYYGPNITRRREKELKGASFDMAMHCVARRIDEDSWRLNAEYSAAYTDAQLWPSQKHCVFMARLAPSLTYCDSFKESQPREIIYEIWEEAEPDKNNKEENTMTNAEMAKQMKEFNERLDRYYDNQELMERVNDRLDRCEEFEDRLDRCIKNLGELNEKTKSIEQRLDSTGDTATYARQVAEDSKKIEDALKITTRKLDLFSQKNLELMERNKCAHKGKECNGQAQECPLAEHFSNLLNTGIWKYSDAAIKPVWTDDAVEKMARPTIFSEFNAGKRAIVFDGSDPHFEATYLDFCRAYDEWCRASEKEDKLYPRSTWKVRGFRMDPLMKCPSIYRDHSSFAIWTEWVEEKDEPTFEYGTLMTDWREHKTVGGLPYTVWKI